MIYKLSETKYENIPDMSLFIDSYETVYLKISGSTLVKFETVSGIYDYCRDCINLLH